MIYDLGLIIDKKDSSDDKKGFLLKPLHTDLIELVKRYEEVKAKQLEELGIPF